MYKNTLFANIFLILITLFFYNSNAQTNIAVWNFESYPGGFTNPSPSAGSGTASVIVQSAINSGTSFNALGTQGGNGNATGCGTTQSGSAWQIFPMDVGTFNESNGLEFKASTLGYENIVFKWDQRWSNSAPNTLRLQYTVDGSTWTNFVMTSGNTTYCLGTLNSNGTYQAATPGDSFRRFTVNLTAIAGAVNNANFGIRLMASLNQTTFDYRQTTFDVPSASYPISTNTGAWRFDNVSFSGSLFAGPSLATISASSATICSGDTVNLSVAITGGQGPFNLIYTNDGGTTQFTVPNYVSGTNIPLNPAITRTYNIVSVQNAAAVIGTSNSSTSNTGSPSISVNAKPTFTAVNGSFCSGSFNLTSLFTLQSPSGGMSTYINDVTNVAIPFVATYTGATVTIRYTYTRNGCSTTKIVTFTRNTAPTITTQPSTATQTVCQGDVFATLTILASATPSPTYQWYRNISASTIGGQALVGASYAAEVSAGSTTANFTPLSNNTSQVYYYYFRANNICGSSPNSGLTGAFTVVPKTTTRTITATQTNVCYGYAPADLTLTGTGTITKWQKSTDSTFATGVIDIANTTATLATGNIIIDTYFRAIVFNGYCDVPTAAVGITIKKANYIAGAWDVTPDATTTAIIWNTFSSTADVSACNFILKAGVAAVFNINHTLTVQNEIDTSAAGASLTFENNSSLYQVNDIANPNSGNIIYKRNSTQMKVYDFTYWSSPVDNQNLYSFSPNTLYDKYFFWDTLPTYYNWRTILNGATSMQRGQGYIVRSPLQPGNAADVFNGIFTGVPNNGSFTKTIEVSNLGVNNLNLLGNPYPSAMNADVFFDVNTSAVYNSLYLWTHNTAVGTFVNFQYSSNDFATYNYAGGVGTSPATNLGVNNGLPNGKIAAGQAFFVRAKNTGSVIFNNTMRVGSNNNQFFKSHNSINTIEKNRLWLEISNINGAFSQLLFGYIQNATDAKDDGFDTNLFNETPTVSFYSVLNNEKMTIKADALPFDENKTNQLGFISKIDSDYEIRLAITDGLFDNQNIYLQDNLLNIVHDLKQSNYNFHSVIGTFNDRFLLRFNNNNLSNNQNIGNQSGIQVFKQNNDILVQSSNNKIASVLIFDLNGRLLLEKVNIDNDRYIINNLLLTNQMILIKTITADGLIITKKIIF